ncbi:peptide-methionine (S)-S-oxide reductase, partial [bacterium]|nr:peptide-methionine (S)-S-oxide reductase [bacterium]
TGSTGHAESVRLEFNSSILSYENLLLHFFNMHNPTTLHRQGNDEGTQYRSVIFFHDEDQHQVALEVIKRVNLSQAWKNPVVTEVCPAQEFWRAEELHQKYLEKNPHGYTCHFIRSFKF